MPFETSTISQAKSHEPRSRALGKAMRELKKMVPGESKLAIIGQELPKAEEPQTEALSNDELAEKGAIANLLLELVEPPMLSKKIPNLVADRLSFTAKVKAMTLLDLKRFIPDRLDARTIDVAKVSEEFKGQLQRKYKDLSP